jgi:hypothetical protein
MTFGDFLVSRAVGQLPFYFGLGILAFLIVTALFPRNIHRLERWYARLAVAAAVFIVAYTVFLTLGQYHVWSNNAFTRILLTLPVDETAVPQGAFFNKLADSIGQPIGYFLFYAYGRFWIELFITLGVSLGLHLILRALRRVRPLMFTHGDVWLITLGTLLSGWPKLLVFLIAFFLFSVFFVIIQQFIFKKQGTDSLVPTISALVLTLFFGNQFITLFGWSVLVL